MGTSIWESSLSVCLFGCRKKGAAGASRPREKLFASEESEEWAKDVRPAIFNYPRGGNLVASRAGRFQSVPIEMKANKTWPINEMRTPPNDR